MNRRLLVIATTLATLLLGSALAQEDNLLQRYDLAIENLQIAVASVPNDGLQARDELERALNALLTLSTNATSPTLVQAMERTFDRTRVAIENQSRTDMAVQTSVLAGGFARLVMDSALTAAAVGETELARTRLNHLATSLGFDAEAQAALNSASNAAEMRLAFEAGAADAVNADVQAALELVGTDRAAAYERLAAAYGESLLVQDSPRATPALNRSLVDAANALVGADMDAAETALEAASTNLTNLAAQARGAEPVVAPLQPQSQEQQPATTPPATDAPTSDEPAATTTEPSQTAEPTVTATEPAAGEPAADDAGLLPLLSGPDFENAVAQRVEELEAERRAADLAVLSRELTLAGVPAALAQSRAEALMEAGVTSLADVLTDMEAAAARAVAAQRGGDVAGARSEIATVGAAYHSTLAPLMLAADADLATATQGLLASLADRSNLTSHDVSLLATQVASVRATLLGGPLPAGQQLEATVDTFWSELTRPVVLIILALMAIVPLVLLNLAFGGSNRNWRLVGWSLFLLLLPVFYEGVAALGGLVGRFVNMPWLGSLTSWSHTSSTVAHAVWALLVFIALLLAIIGLYGICVQFGLLGSGKQRAAAAAAPAPERRPTGNTTIDWDEEF